MAILKPFKGLRPPAELAELVASRPYDVLSSEEAREEAAGNPYSLLHITKPEIDCPPGTGEYDSVVYDTARRNFDRFLRNGWLVRDEMECLYIYAQTMNGKTQYGLAGCAGIVDYMNDRIKKHELTRRDKEADRMKHVRVTNANLEPVFFTYRAVAEIDSIVASWTRENRPIYDFVAGDGVGHHFWVIDDVSMIGKIVRLFERIPCTYVADGHHRTAAAVLVGSEKKAGNPGHTGDEKYNYFLAVHYPENQLGIIDYNRVIKDLNGLEEAVFINRLSGVFEIREKGGEIYRPDRVHNFSLYLGGKWYSLTARPGTWDDRDPIGSLDVTILSDKVFDKILGIKDLRTDKRIDFVGGIRGYGELRSRVDSGEMRAAFGLYPVSMNELMDIADTGNIMTPKTTWFEPKLRSGLMVYELD